MPNGQDSELPKIREKSRFWGAVWQIGDAAYYIGLLTSLSAPIVLATCFLVGMIGPQRPTLAASPSHAVMVFVLAFFGGFPVGIAFRNALQTVACRRTNVERH